MIDQGFLKDMLKAEKEEVLHKFNVVRADISKYSLKLEKLGAEIDMLEKGGDNMDVLIDLKREYRANLLIYQTLDRLRVELVREYNKLNV